VTVGGDGNIGGNFDATDARINASLTGETLYF
jgi:hypothetical protein